MDSVAVLPIMRAQGRCQEIRHHCVALQRKTKVERTDYCRLCAGIGQAYLDK